MTITISAILITKNEELRIDACLSSLEWADEIIVVDSGSSDRTRELCERQSRVKFFELPWEGFGIQKNRALDRASGEWIFSIDADEIVSPELAGEILDTVRHASYDGYVLKRKNYYRGQWIRHCGWWPDPIVRLFRKNKGRFNDRLVHESVEIQGMTGELKNPIEHHSFQTAADFIRKADSYSTLGAQQMKLQNRSISALDACTHAFATFIKVYFLKGGIFDGRAGLLIAVSNSIGVFYRYIKYLELHDSQADQNFN